ncbi:phosphoribosylformylglycinamidine cyclo-ligase [Paenibacillus sp.]|uniref:phosphoribosylformylglycinamidine cyclo-ligase n=1 Tax=Paenibacillus sp. TaxID=58172 RepID=UPI002D324011|nr:phosphoribosylformylglycinamidine cyclo-ligase [Paenibacillus sp.]HZG58548.1 phosphoribosylformylglycinamidine cyclo-ligase [Paenibacillus sp.]
MSEAYKQAGVNIAAGNEAVERMKRHVARTTRPEVIGGLGGFGGLFAMDREKYKEPILVSGTDGVGTKLKVAFAADKHDTVGIDAVAMCVNDIVVQGAEPLFFLDYLAVGTLEPGKVESIVAGVAEGCVQAGCALIGGETAEMPSMYQDGEYDIAGFTVGVVEKSKMIDGSGIRAGDAVIGLASSGVHSNGFSLVRKLLLDSGKYGVNDVVPALGEGVSLGEALLAPTRIYVKPVLKLIESVAVRGMAHITGGGFIENIPRVLPSNVNAHIRLGSWPMPPIFGLLRAEGSLTHDDCYRTFNMGIGYVIVVPADEREAAMNALTAAGETPYEIGVITEGTGVVTFEGAEA